MALVLSRKLGEEIVIGEPGPDQIVVTLKKLGKRRVELGIQARRDMPVHRRDAAELQSPIAPGTLPE